MCGMFGWNLDEAKISRSRRAALASALMAGNDERGGDGWGYYSPEWPADATPRRGLGDMMRRVRAGQLGRLSRLMAHTRYATTGAKTAANAHPFDLPAVVGAHNGCVANHRDLNHRYGRNCAVDSQHIFLHLAEGRPLSDIEAYGAVEYVYRGDPGVMYLARFHGGELSVAELPSGIVWSSDRKHLRAALHCAGLSHQMYVVEEDNLYYTERGDGVLRDSGLSLGISPFRSLAAGFALDEYAEDREIDSLLWDW